MIAVERLAKTFASKSETVAAVQDVSFEAKTGELVTLLGPSGCGKTTTLRLVAGLERAERGRIAVGGRDVFDCGSGLFAPPHLRNLGMVFQSYAIWPHMTVLQNVAYALEGKHLGHGEVRKRAMAALATVQLEALADRPAPRLSGGQQQRVAIARALAGEPAALLFDEPLSNLDAKLRAEMRGEIRHLQRRLGLTSLYVTHDQSEALAMSDWIMIMREGRIVERGRPEDIYRRPRTVFTARFIGDANLLAGRVVSVDSPAARVAVDTQIGRLVGIDTNGALKPNDDAVVSIRPEDIAPIPDGAAAPTDRNLIRGIVTDATFAGAAVETEIRIGDTPLRWLARHGVARPGDSVVLGVDVECAVVLPAES